MIKNVIFAVHYEKQSEATVESLFFFEMNFNQKSSRFVVVGSRTVPQYFFGGSQNI